MATLSEIIHRLSNFSVSPTLTIPDSRRIPSQLRVGICPSSITHTKEGPEAARGRSPGLLAATGEGNSGESLPCTLQANWFVSEEEVSEV